jgi:hypothetical protein
MRRLIILETFSEVGYGGLDSDVMGWRAYDLMGILDLRYCPRGWLSVNRVKEEDP